VGEGAMWIVGIIEKGTEQRNRSLSALNIDIGDARAHDSWLTFGVKSTKIKLPQKLMSDKPHLTGWWSVLLNLDRVVALMTTGFGLLRRGGSFA
jgi:hypothetical protein